MTYSISCSLDSSLLAKQPNALMCPTMPTGAGAVCVRMMRGWCSLTRMTKKWPFLLNGQRFGSLVPCRDYVAV